MGAPWGNVCATPPRPMHGHWAHYRYRYVAWCCPAYRYSNLACTLHAIMRWSSTKRRRLRGGGPDPPLRPFPLHAPSWDGSPAHHRPGLNNTAMLHPSVHTGTGNVNCPPLAYYAPLPYTTMSPRPQVTCPPLLLHLKAAHASIRACSTPSALSYARRKGKVRRMRLTSQLEEPLWDPPSSPSL